MLHRPPLRPACPAAPLPCRLTRPRRSRLRSLHTPLARSPETAGWDFRGHHTRFLMWSRERETLATWRESLGWWRPGFRIASPNGGLEGIRGA